MPNEAFNLLFPPSILAAETPIAIRYVLALTVSGYEVLAACSRKFLSFFGTEDHIPQRFCESSLSRTLISSQITYRVLISEYPTEGRPYGRFLVRNGLNPFDKSTDTRTEVGWANVIAERLIKYFRGDRWNSQGDLTKGNYRFQFEDPTGYRPANRPDVAPDELQRPLRWQPLADFDQHGWFASQVHVAPHIGVSVDPLVLSQSDFQGREAPPLYSTPNRRNSISKADAKFATGLIKKLFKRSRKMMKEKIVLSYYWENKFVSLGSFVAIYQGLLGFDAVINVQILMGEVLSQYDALLVAWKEKRKNDNIRPTTLIKRLFKGKKVRAFRGIGKGFGVVDAEEWEPIVPVQPHSEYPSASALICSANFEHLKIALETLALKKNVTIPPYEFTVTPAVLPGNPIEEPVKITFQTPEAASESCGQSRLDSGVHFEPSVPVGHLLGKGIGKAAFEHMQDLVNGKVPKNCARCIKS